MDYQITKRGLYFLLLVVLSSSIVAAQDINDGIYFIIDDKKCLYNKVKIYGSRSSACIPDNPVLLFEDIDWLGELELDENTGTRELLMELSEKGSKILATISEVYLGKKLAFVFKNEVVFVLLLDQVVNTGRISLVEKSKSTSLTEVREAIAEILERKEDP
ncbi:MAG: hypothetical protein AAGA31_12815 [Bacteroidota bacterium]